MSGSVVDARLHAVQVTPRTRWAFVELRDDAGRAGTGEATLAEHDGALSHAFDTVARRLDGCAVNEQSLDAFRAEATTLAEFAVVSALDHALWDLIGQRDGQSVADALGGRRLERVSAYANVNRAATSRTPEAFAEVAGHAVAEGFRAVKIAPFDGIELYGHAGEDAPASLLDAAFARVAAVRSAIGTDVELMVDCHWRLNAATALQCIDSLARFDVRWLECPLPETLAFVERLRALRSRANVRGMRVAGCEQMSRIDGFAPWLRAGAYDVMMPDVKYVGGLREMLAVAAELQSHGVECVPHNPSGPIAHAVTLQACAAAGLRRAEIQFRETPYFDALCDTVLPTPVDGVIAVPKAPGLGVALDSRIVEGLRVDPRR
jgi:galactonate dehydratase